jgi:hypothetical protein
VADGERERGDDGWEEGVIWEFNVRGWPWERLCGSQWSWPEGVGGCYPALVLRHGDGVDLPWEGREAVGDESVDLRVVVEGFFGTAVGIGEFEDKIVPDLEDYAALSLADVAGRGGVGWVCGRWEREGLRKKSMRFCSFFGPGEDVWAEPEWEEGIDGVHPWGWCGRRCE